MFNGGYCKCRWLSGDCRHFCHCRTFNYSRICRRSSQCRRLQTTLCIRYQNFEKALSGSLAVPAIPGKRPYKKSSSGFVPSADSHCTNCGLCAEKCPAQAISKDNGKVTDKSKCISCMRCVSICPVHARSLNKVTVSVVASAIKKACSVQKSNELFL